VALEVAVAPQEVLEEAAAEQGILNRAVLVMYHLQVHLKEIRAALHPAEW
jgi:hypothetical protein